MSAPLSKEQWQVLRQQSTQVVPDMLAELGVPSVLLPYQAKAVGLLDSTAVEVLFIEKSRRIGLTWGLASYAALRAGRTKSAGGMDVMYISYSQEMTREFIDACAMWSRSFNKAALSVDEFLFDDSDKDGDRSIQAFRIRFASGFEILALSSAPRTLRGKQGVVIIDEAAFVDSLPELLKAALAFLMWGGQVVVCSTHNGVDNEFNRQIQEILSGRSIYSHIRIDFDDALKDGLYERICLVKGTEYTIEGEAIWRQKIIDFYGDGADEELYCIPTLGSGTWLSSPLIEARMVPDIPILRLELPLDYLQRPELERRSFILPFMVELSLVLDKLDPARMHALGFDFARVADLSVVFLLALSKTLKRDTVLVVEMRGVPHSEQAAIVRDIMKAAPRLIGAAFDATGSGEYVAETMGREFGFAPKDEGAGGGLVAAIKLSQEWYRVNMPPVKTAFEDAAISIPKDDDILSDLSLVKVERGIPMVPAVRTGTKGKKRHGDAAVALALAYFASKMQAVSYGYTPAPPRPSKFDHEHGSDDRPYRMASMRRRGGIF